MATRAIKAKEKKVDSSFRGRVFTPSARRGKRQPVQWKGYVRLVSFVCLVGGLGGAFWMELPQKAADTTVQWMINTSGKVGFRVTDVMVQGRHFASSQKILQAVQLKQGDPIFDRSPSEIKGALEKISWVHKASVQRYLPGKIYIEVKERVPVAVWQHQKVHYLVDADGIVISNEKLDEFSALPIIVGGDAPVHAPELLAILRQFPEIQKRISALVRVGGRRWDLQLDRKITVKLPEEKLENALPRLLLLIQQQKLDSKDISVVDLRLPDQIILRLSPIGELKLTGKGSEA